MPVIALKPATDRNAKFADLIRRAREKAGLNQYELAARVKKPQSYISKIERSERKLTMMDLEAIALALESDPITLLMPLYHPKSK
jgi:transcriptional regulator with XRE-family HTH domain